MPHAQAQQAIAASLDEATKDPKNNIHGVAFIAVDKNGDVLAQHASGTRSQKNGNDLVDMDTMFWIASCTKFIATIAGMQLVEQGKIPLDDSQWLYKIVPELEKKEVFDYEKGVLRPRKGEITFRMLLAHTAGFGYAFFDPRVNMYGQTIGRTYSEWTGVASDILDQPLMNDPGSMWEYGINIDWAGVVIERVSGLKLSQYCEKNIFQPLGIEHITFFPTAEDRKNMMTIVQRAPEGTLSDREHLWKAVFEADTPEKQDKFFNSGGAGAFARPADYVKILAAVLNDGVSAKTGNRILKKETIDLMWENQIPQFPDFARMGAEPADPTLANKAPEMYPQAGNPPQGWGLSMFLTIQPGETGRGANTGWWAGISNQYWWCDREKGVAGICAGQVLPFGDMSIITQWFGCEKAVYDALK